MSSWHSHNYQSHSHIFYCHARLDRASFCITENHRLGRWVQKSLLALSPRKNKNPLITIKMRSANCITIKSKDLKWIIEIITRWRIHRGIASIISYLPLNLEGKFFTVRKGLKSERCWENFASGNRSIFWRLRFVQITFICWSRYLPKSRFPVLSDTWRGRVVWWFTKSTNLFSSNTEIGNFGVEATMLTRLEKIRQELQRISKINWRKTSTEISWQCWVSSSPFTGRR